MANFKYILKEMHLLTEDAQVNDISDAINGMHPAFIVYNDMKGMKGKSKRKIYPVAYGISTAGNPVIRAFQPSGSSKRGVPKWKLFRLDRITKWDTRSEENYDPEKLVGINKDGDKQISTLYTIAPIGKGKKISKDLNGINLKPSPILKKDIDSEGDVEQKEKDERQEESKKQYNANDIVNKIVNDITKNNIDKNQEKPYNSSEWDKNKIETDVDSPITRGEIDNDSEGDINPAGPDIPNVSANPITKGDLEVSDNDDEEDKKKNPMTDLMARMDNLDNKEENED